MRSKRAFRKRVRALLHALVCFLILLGGCSEKQGKETEGSGSSEAGPKRSGDSLFHPVEISHAQRFDITYRGDHKVVEVNRPWPDAQKGFRYVLHQRGTEPPKRYDDARFVEVPVPKIACLSSISVAFMRELGLLDKLAAVSSADRIYDKKVREGVEEGRIKAVGGNADINIERIMALRPLLVATYGSGDPARDVHSKLTEADIPVAIQADFMERTPLGRAEWIKFLAAFLNKEKKAAEIFSAIEETYKRYSKLAKGAEEKPTVITGRNRGGTCWVPGGRSYMARFLKDAGANYLWGADTASGSIKVAFEAFYEKGHKAQYWVLNEAAWRSRDAMKSADDRYARFRAFQTGNVFDIWGRVGSDRSNDYFETGVAAPHLVLKDLIRIFHPDLLPQHEMLFYRRLESSNNSE